MLTTPCFDLCQIFADGAKIAHSNAIKGAVFSTAYLIAWAHYIASTRDSNRQGALAMFLASNSISWKRNNACFLPATATLYFNGLDLVLGIRYNKINSCNSQNQLLTGLIPTKSTQFFNDLWLPWVCQRSLLRYIIKLLIFLKHISYGPSRYAPISIN